MLGIGLKNECSYSSQKYSSIHGFGIRKNEFQEASVYIKLTENTVKVLFCINCL